MHKDTPEDIKDILAGLKSKSELGRNLEEAKIWEYWDSIVPAPFNAHAYPLRVKNSLLYIEAETAVWMHKISYLKQEILEKLRGIIDPDLVDDLRIVLEEEDKPDPRKKEG